MLLFRTLFLFLTFVCGGLIADQSASFPPNHDEDEGSLSPMSSEARANAMAWLTLMDQSQYAATWDEAGPILKDVVSRKQWVAAMRELRLPLGYASARKIDAQRTMDRLKHGTRGYFMEIIYSTTFWGRGGARERVILMYNELSQWVVIHYSIE